MVSFVVVFVFKQKTAYEMRISDWSSDVCSSDLHGVAAAQGRCALLFVFEIHVHRLRSDRKAGCREVRTYSEKYAPPPLARRPGHTRRPPGNGWEYHKGPKIGRAHV